MYAVVAVILAFGIIGFYAPIFQPFLSEQVRDTANRLNSCTCSNILSAFGPQFNLDTTVVGFVFFLEPMTYLITAFFAGPLSDKLVRTHGPLQSFDTELSFHHRVLGGGSLCLGSWLLVYALSSSAQLNLLELREYSTIITIILYAPCL